ncbi:hypothetical protein BASA81_017308 [Batrachochytrium salamandrivorans]|nr:hypothetical protein BASA81_017308 [Batrachochytrium salamandrivorans]
MAGSLLLMLAIDARICRDSGGGGAVGRVVLVWTAMSVVFRIRSGFAALAREALDDVSLRSSGTVMRNRAPYFVVRRSIGDMFHLVTRMEQNRAE